MKHENRETYAALLTEYNGGHPMILTDMMKRVTGLVGLTATAKRNLLKDLDTYRKFDTELQDADDETEWVRAMVRGRICSMLMHLASDSRHVLGRFQKNNSREEWEETDILEMSPRNNAIWLDHLKEYLTRRQERIRKDAASA